MHLAAARYDRVAAPRSGVVRSPDDGKVLSDCRLVVVSSLSPGLADTFSTASSRHGSVELIVSVTRNRPLKDDGRGTASSWTRPPSLPTVYRADRLSGEVQEVVSGRVGGRAGRPSARQVTGLRVASCRAGLAGSSQNASRFEEQWYSR